MKIETQIWVHLEKSEGFTFEASYGTDRIDTYRATLVRWHYGNDTARINAVRLYKNGKETSNGFPFTRTLDSLPEALQARLRAIQVTGEIDPAHVNAGPEESRH